MSDKNQKKIKNKSNQLQNNQLSSNKYTYDIYGRQHTRSFDTDFSKGKEGFERVDTYHYDSLNRLIRTDTDLLGQGDNLDRYTIVDKNTLGYNIVSTQYNADGSIAIKNINEFDAYGQIYKQTTLNKDGVVTFIRVYELRDAHGRVLRETEDINVIGKWDNGDRVLEFTRDTDPNGTVLNRKVTNFGSVVNEKWEYDEFGRQILALSDTNGDNQISPGELYTRAYYVGNSTLSDRVKRYLGDDSNFLWSHKMIREDNTGPIIATAISNNKEEFTRIEYQVYGERSTIEDYTTPTYQALFDEIGGHISSISMTSSNYKTQITLDNDTLAKLAHKVANGRVQIGGDASDTLTLKDSGEFVKLGSTVKIGSNDYTQYTTEVEGKTYTLLVDTDINVIPM